MENNLLSELCVKYCIYAVFLINNINNQLLLAMWVVDAPINSSIGSSVSLPCNIISPIQNDTLLLLLFYRNESIQPLYTLDSRQSLLLSNATIYYNHKNVEQRFKFELKNSVLYLHIRKLISSDTGIYRCRLDFRYSRTINRLIKLLVTEPIQSVQIFDEKNHLIKKIAGPFNEDTNTSFTCVSIGGNPSASIKWLLKKNTNNKLLNVTLWKSSNDPTASTIYILMTRSLHGQQLICEAQNQSNKIRHNFTIYLNLKPDKIELNAKHTSPLKEGELREYWCKSIGNTSKTLISWWKSEFKEQKLNTLQNSILNTTLFTKLVDGEVLKFYASADDNGKILKCKVQMASLNTFELSKQITIEVLFKPIVFLVMGSTTNNQQLLEGTNLFFECNVQANPAKIKIKWLFNGHLLDDLNNEKNSNSFSSKHNHVNINKYNLNKNRLLENISFRNKENSFMSIKLANRAHNGIYECVANNSLGSQHSEPIILDFKYTPSCKNGHQLIQKTLPSNSLIDNHNVTIDCPLEIGNPIEMNVCWYLVNISSEKYCKEVFQPSDHIHFTIPEKILSNNSNETKIQILCWAVNSVGLQETPCVIQLYKKQLSSQEFFDCQIQNTSRHSLIVNCQLNNSSLIQTIKKKFPIIYHLNVYDNTGKLLNQLSNLNQPVFELNELPSDKPLRLSVFSSNSHNLNNKIILQTTILVPSKWKSDDEQKFVFLSNPIIYIFYIILILCLFLVFLFVLKRLKIIRKNKTNLQLKDKNNKLNIIKKDQINFTFDRVNENNFNYTNDIHDNYSNKLDCVELVAHEDPVIITSDQICLPKAVSNNLESFSKIENNIQLVDTIFLYYQT